MCVLAFCCIHLVNIIKFDDAVRISHSGNVAASGGSAGSIATLPGYEAVFFE